MIKYGDFFHDPQYPESIFIYVDDLTSYNVSLNGSICDEPNIKTKFFDKLDRIISIEIVNQILKNPVFPQWVNDILNKPKTETTSVRSGVKLYNSGPMPASPPPMINSLQTLRETCQHQWREYTGFREFYLFCSHCDKKRRF